MISARPVNRINRGHRRAIEGDQAGAETFDGNEACNDGDEARKDCCNRYQKMHSHYANPQK